MSDASLQYTLDRYLSKFEEMIDPQRPAHARQVCERAFAFEPLDELPYVWGNGTDGVEVDTDWPTFPYNDTFGNRTKMLLDQLYAPFIHHQLDDYHPLNIRCNFGTVIMPSVFGVPYRLTETSLPWADHLASRDEVRALIDRGVPDLRAELGGRCFETAEYYMETLSAYPKLSETIVIYHPDMQGPFDIAHLIWGPDIFMGIYDCPKMVHELLALATETYAAYMRAWKTLIGEDNVFTTQWNFYMKGGIMIRDDTPVMLRTDHYEELVKPYDQALLDEFGGCIHFCGRGDAFIASMCESRNLYGIHSSQPDWNDVDLLIRSTLDNNIALLGLPEQYVPAEANTGIIVLRQDGLAACRSERNAVKLFDDLAAILKHVEAALDLQLTEDDLADGLDDIAHVFLHEVCHAALAHAAPWVLDLLDEQHTAVDEVVARLIEDQMATQLGLYVHTPKQHVHELSGYPVHITVEQYTHLHEKWRAQYGPAQNPAGLARYALHYLFPETGQ